MSGASPTPTSQHHPHSRPRNHMPMTGGLWAGHRAEGNRVRSPKYKGSKAGRCSPRALASRGRCHKASQTGGLKTTVYSLTVSGGWESAAWVAARPCSSEGSRKEPPLASPQLCPQLVAARSNLSLRLRVASSTLDVSSASASPSLSLMKTSDTGFRTIIIQDDLIFTSDTCKDPISKEGYFLGFWVNVKTLGGHYSTNTRC